MESSTSSREGSPPRVGSQVPTYHVCPPYAMTHGPLSVELCQAYRYVLDPWQQYIMNDWLARDAQGRLLCVTAGVGAPRQNGKTGIVVGRIMPGVLVFGESILYTAHESKTAEKVFKRLTEGFFGTEANDPYAPFRDLNRLVKKVIRGNGRRAIEFKSGAAIECMTRTDSAGRGDTRDTIIYDEAQELTDKQYEALSALNDAAPLGSPQSIFLGTPPDPGCGAEVFSRIHAEAHAGGSPYSCWSEWAVDSVGDVTDHERWYATNPGLGIRIDERTIEAKLASMAPESFARERLGYFRVVSAKRPIDPGDWARCAETEPTDGERFFAAAFSAVGTYAVAVAVRCDGRPVHVEVVKAGVTKGRPKEVARTLARCADVASAIAVYGVQGAPIVRAELQGDRQAKRVLKEPSPRNFVEATAMFADAVANRGVTHFGQENLTASALGCVKKNQSAGAWVFGATDDADPAPVEAALLAYWAAATAPAKKKRGKAKLL